MLDGYSTQIVPPQELFGLGEGHAAKESVLSQIGTSLLAGLIMGFVANRTFKKAKDSFIVKNKTALTLGVAIAGAAGVFAIQRTE